MQKFKGFSECGKAAMADFGDDEYLGMLCVETTNAVEDSVTLAPGQSHTLQAKIRIEVGS